MDPSGVSMKALERAIAVVNRIITKSTVQKGGKGITDAKSKGKWTKISAKARGKTAVTEAENPKKSLAQYLALPIEEYSLLDPSWITREPDSIMFCLSAPVRGITGVDLEPKVWVTVDVDTKKGMVSFHSDRACTGDATMDERLKLSFEGKLWHQPAKAQHGRGKLRPVKAEQRSQGVLSSDSSAMPMLSGEYSLAADLSASSTETVMNGPSSVATLQQSPFSPVASLSEASSNGSSSTAVAVMPAPARAEHDTSSSSSREYSFTAAVSDEAAAAGTGSNSQSNAPHGSSTLHANAKVWASVKLGPPLNVVPGFLISYTGGLIATAVLQALMPLVLDLLARDYKTWATGESRAALH